MSRARDTFRRLRNTPTTLTLVVFLLTMILATLANAAPRAVMAELFSTSG